MWLRSPLFFTLSSSLSFALILRGEQYPPHELDQRGTSHGSVHLEQISSPVNRYVSNITLNNQTFRALIDTGSSDLWVVTSSSFQYRDVGIPLNLYYGSADSPSTVSGTLGFAAVQLGNYKVSQQAFMNATHATVGGVIEDGLDGVIGLSFDGPGASPITKALEKQGVIGPLGQPFLYNVFDETPSQNNFIGISLSRTGDLEGSAEALFTINEYDEDYEAVADAPHVPLFPGPPMSSRWSVLVDSIVVDSFPLSIQSVVPGTPEGKLVVLMDTGVPTASLPASLRDQLYSRIAGAQYYKPYDKWIVPCGATAIVWVSIGGQRFPIHPLDLSDVLLDTHGEAIMDSKGDPYCFSTINAGSGSNYDSLFGNTFMRNWYTVFNFGNEVSKSVTVNSSLQLLSQTNPAKAAQDVVKVRMARLKTVTCDGKPKVAAALGDSDGSGTSSDPQLKKYGPIVIGLLTANLLVLLVLIGIGLMAYMKKSGPGGTRGTSYAPVELKDDEPNASRTYYDTK